MASKTKKSKKNKITLIISPALRKKIKQWLTKIKQWYKKSKRWFKKNYSHLITASVTLLILIIAYFFIKNYSQEKEKEIKRYVIISYNKVLYKDKEIKNKKVLDAIKSYETGYLEKAKFLFQSALKLQLSEIEKKAALVNLANIFDDYLHYNLAVKYLQKALEVDKKDGLIYHNLGIVYKHNNKYQKAVDALLLAVKYNKKFVKSYLSLASLYFYLNNYSKALLYYTRAGNLNPDDSEIMYNKGICFFKLKKKDKGIKALEKIISSEYLSDEIKNEASKSLGNYFAQEGNYEKSLFYFKKAIEFKDEYDVHYRLATLYKFNGKYDKAMSHFEKAYKLNAKSDNTIKNLAELYLRFGEYDKALKHYKYLTRHYKAKTEILLLMGDIYLKKDDIHQAVSSYKKALEFSPTPDEAKIAYVNLGNLYLKLKNYTEALKLYNKALEIDKLDTNILYNISLVYLENNDFENALENLNKAIKLDPDNMQLYLIKSRLLFQEDKIDLSINNFVRLIEKFPNEILGYFELGNLYYKIKDYKNAEHYFKLALDMNTGTDYQYKIYANFSTIYIKKKEYNKALEYINKAFILNSREPLINYNYGLIYFNTGEYEKAKDYFHQATRMPGNDDIKAMAYLSLGNIHFQEKEYSLAESMYEKAKKHDPDFTEAFYNLKVLKEKKY